MAEDEKDVNASEASTEEKDPSIQEEELDSLLSEETEESKDSEEKSEEEESEKSEEEGSKDALEKEKETEGKDEQVRKLEEEKANLLKALQEKRRSERQKISEPSKSTPGGQEAIDADTYIRAQIAAVEKTALDEMYKIWPDLSPEKDPDNAFYNEFRKEFALASRLKGVVPVTKEQFLEIGDAVMTYKFGRKRVDAEEKKMAIADAKREAQKAQAGNLGGTQGSSEEKSTPEATDADRRAAKTAGMSIENYLKFKDFYKEESV